MQFTVVGKFLVKFLILPEREYGHRKISVKSFNFYCLLFTEVWDVSPPSGSHTLMYFLVNVLRER